MSRGSGIALVSIGAALALCIGVLFVLHMVSREVEGEQRGVVTRVARRLPLQAVKIVIVVWQILTQASGQRCAALIAWTVNYFEVLDNDVLQ